MPNTQLLDAVRAELKTISGWRETASRVVSDQEVRLSLSYTYLYLGRKPNIQIDAELDVIRHYQDHFDVYVYLPYGALSGISSSALRTAIYDIGWCDEPDPDDDEGYYRFCLEIEGLTLSAALTKALHEAQKLGKVIADIDFAFKQAKSTLKD